MVDTSPPERRVSGGGGATRYARPCRPVKPLLMMEDVGIRSVKHFWQRRCDTGRLERKEVGCGGEDEGEPVEAEIVELRRLRKGILGRR